MSAKVFKGGSTRDNSKKETQIKALSSRRMSIIHPAYLEILLSDSPNIPILIPNHLGRKVLIEGVIDVAILMKSIGLKPFSKCGISVLMTLQSLLSTAIFVKIKDN